MTSSLNLIVLQRSLMGIVIKALLFILNDAVKHKDYYDVIMTYVVSVWIGEALLVLATAPFQLKNENSKLQYEKKLKLYSFPIERFLYVFHFQPIIP